MGDNFSKQGELDLYFCCPSHSAELGGEGRYVLVFSAGWLQSPEESTALPLSLFCLLSVQCAGRPEQLRWYGDGVLASVPIWAVCLCAVQRGARGRRRGSTQGSIRATTKSRPLLEPLPSPLPAPPSCTGCKL